MNLVIRVKLSGSEREKLRAQLLTEAQRNLILKDVGAKFKYLTLQNFGVTGTDRPTEWAPLSEDYAKRVKRSYATMDLKGDLFRSFRVGQPDGTSITVSTSISYAEAQQYGTDRMPPRPFFPITADGGLTNHAQNVLETTASLSLQRIMRGGVK